ALNPDVPGAKIAAILDRLDRGRGKLLDALSPPDKGVLIAVHNNRNYSMNDEIAISDAVAKNEEAHTRDFFLATDPADYAIVAKSPYNVVLQKDGPREDDGSMSRLAARSGFRYVNLEVEVGAYQKQREMLEWLERSLP